MTISLFNLLIFVFHSLKNSKCQRACEKLDLDCSIEKPVMAFFWPIRQKGEPADTQEDPYDVDVTKPKRLRKESSSSDEDGVDKKHFGHLSGSSSESSSSSESDDEKEVKKERKFEEITDVNEEEDEYQVNLRLPYVFWASFINIQYNLMVLSLSHFADDRKGRNVNYLPSDDIFLLPLVWNSLPRCRRHGIKLSGHNKR